MEGFFGDSGLEGEGGNIFDVVFGDVLVEVFIDFEEVNIVGEDGEFGGK